MKTTARTLAAAFVLGCLVGPAFADGDPRTDEVPRLLPYQGQLELDGRPVEATGDAALHLLFSLYDGPDAEQPVYRQPLVVEVYGGRFTATIGPEGEGPDGAVVPIDGVIAAADDLHLGLTLLGDPDDPADDIPLANRQRIYATPYAMWTTSATNLSVARDAAVGGNATVGGDIEVTGEARIGGGMRVTGPVRLDAGSVDLQEIDPAIAGRGINRSGAALDLDDGYLDARISDWVRNHCKVQLGWRDSCSNCGSAPAKIASAGADATCLGGQNSACRQGTWAGFNTDGNVNDDDVFYIRFLCE